MFSHPSYFVSICQSVIVIRQFWPWQFFVIFLYIDHPIQYNQIGLTADSGAAGSPQIVCACRSFPLGKSYFYGNDIQASVHEEKKIIL